MDFYPENIKQVGRFWLKAGGNGDRCVPKLRRLIHQSGVQA